jgi:hypothetical protein
MRTLTFTAEQMRAADPTPMYSGIARCRHLWVCWDGSHVIDDFGNSVRIDTEGLADRLRQEH